MYSPKLWLDLEKVSDPQVSRTKAIRKGDSRSALHFFEDCVKRIKNSQNTELLKRVKKKNFKKPTKWHGQVEIRKVEWHGQVEIRKVEIKVK